MSQIDELRTTTANKDQEIMDCRKAIERLQISVQQLTSQLEKCQKNATIDSKKISTLESKVDELSSNLLTFSFRISTRKEVIGKIQESEMFELPSLSYQFQINALLEDGKTENLIIWVSVLCAANVQPNVSFEVFLINRHGIKVSKESTDDQKSQIRIFRSVIFQPFNLLPTTQWITNDHLQIFCRINRFNSISMRT